MIVIARPTSERNICLEVTAIFFGFLMRLTSRTWGDSYVFIDFTFCFDSTKTHNCSATYLPYTPWLHFLGLVSDSAFLESNFNRLVLSHLVYWLACWWGLEPWLFCLGTILHLQSTQWHVFGLWEEIKAPGRNPHGLGNNANTTQKVSWPWIEHHRNMRIYMHLLHFGLAKHHSSLVLPMHMKQVIACSISLKKMLSFRVQRVPILSFRFIKLQISTACIFN